MRELARLYLTLIRFGLILPRVLIEEFRAEPFDYESRTNR